MQAGLLNKTIEIYKPISITNEVGATSTKWVYIRSTRANVRNMNMGRGQQINEIFYPTTKQITIRSYHEIDEFYRIKYDDKMYKITSKDNRPEFNDIVLICDLINE